MVKHRELDSKHPFAFYQETDPADPGDPRVAEVRPGIGWIKPSDLILQVRNLDDDGWDDVGAIPGALNNVTTTDPGVGDDSGDGYSVGSRWINTTGDGKEFVCTDASVGAAVWLQTAPGVSPIDAEDVAYNNGTSGLAATDVQAAIDEIAALGGGGGGSPAVWHTVGGGGEPAYQNSWGPLGSGPGAAFTKDAIGVVHLRGLIDGGGSGTVVFTLPSGYRPTTYVYPATAQVDGANSTVGIEIGDNGEVKVRGTATWVSLDSLTFPTADLLGWGGA